LVYTASLVLPTKRGRGVEERERREERKREKRKKKKGRRVKRRERGKGRKGKGGRETQRHNHLLPSLFVLPPFKHLPLMKV